MKSIDEIKLEITKYVLNTSYGDKTKLIESTMIFREGYFDSMGFVSLIAFLEETFSVKTSDEDLIEENFESINAIVQYISKKIA